MRRGLRVVVALLALGAVARAEAPAEAPAPPVVMLFSTPEVEPLAGRIEAELVAAGLAPRRVPVARATRFEDLAALAGAEHAAGAVRVDPDGASAEMWIADVATGRVELRQSLSADGSAAMASVIAVRTAEFLRVSLLPGTRPQSTPVVVAPAPPPTVTFAPRTLLRLALAPAYLVSAGGVGASLSMAAIMGLQGRRFGLDGVVIAPLLAGHLDTMEGSTRVSAVFAGVGARVRFGAGTPWRGDAAVGALGALVRVTGTSSDASLVSASAELRGAALYARAGATYDLGTRVALRADLLVGDLIPRAVIQLGTRDAATWGRPFGAALFGLEAGIL